MEQSLTAWLLPALALVAGVAIGFLIARLLPNAAPNKVQRQMDDLQDRFDSYQREVVTHFNTTASLVKKLTQSYQLHRPWADQFGAGYQLSQALIAFGRGGWLGMGLGNSIQKQFYLPEAHTDFVFAVLAEELGIVGALATVALFVFVSLRALYIGIWAEQAKQFFSAYVPTAWPSSGSASS